MLFGQDSSKQGDSTFQPRLYSLHVTSWHQNTATCGRTLAMKEHLLNLTVHLSQVRRMPIQGRPPHRQWRCGEVQAGPHKVPKPGVMTSPLHLIHHNRANRN